MGGGNNTVVPEKKLKKEALQTYGKYEIAAIIKQVTYGNGAMPAFGERLGPDDIEDVANYVRDQADKGWGGFDVRRVRCGWYRPGTVVFSPLSSPRRSMAGWVASVGKIF